MLGNSNPTLAGDRLKETAISPARPVVDDCGHPDYGCDSRGPWSRRHVCGYRRAALVLSTVYLECSAEPRLVGAGGTLANLIFGAPFWVVARAVTAVGIWALLLLAAYDPSICSRQEDISCSPVSATSATGLRSWRDGSPRGHGASP
jgi:hypothetical protein